MEFLSTFAMILLSLMGYSGSIVYRAGKTLTPQPALIDLLLIALMWAGLLILRFSFDIVGYLRLITGLGTGVVIAAATLPFRTLEGERIAGSEGSDHKQGFLKKVWTSWLDLSKRIGHYQSRITLAILYLTLVAPVGITIRFFSDPLDIKKADADSHWTETKPCDPDTDQYRRQY